ncbi:hypothetical protein V8E53_008032 [Lactarius tabidus]
MGGPWPEGADQVITHAKELFHLKILTMNTMWPDTTAYLAAKDQLLSADGYLKSGQSLIRWQSKSNLTTLPKVLHEGSHIWNKFKKAAQQLILHNCYNTFPTGPHFLDAEHTKQHTSQKVSTLLNRKTGMWMHNSRDANGDINYFEHPAVEELIIVTIFALPQSIGCCKIDHFRCLVVPTLALACCALHCTLEEWESGVHLLVTFEVATYRELYLGIVANFKVIEGRPPLCAKLEVLWAQIHHCGW